MDMTGLHDTVFNAVGEDLNKDQLKQVYAALPDHIRGQARLHGIGDGKCATYFTGTENGCPELDGQHRRLSRRG